MRNRNRRRPHSDAHHLRPHLRWRGWAVCRDGGQRGLNDTQPYSIQKSNDKSLKGNQP